MKHVYSAVSTTMEAARLVRHSMEQFVPSLEAEGLRFDSGDLCGACGIASYTLHKVLSAVGVRSDFVMGRFYKNDWNEGQHCWVDVLYPALRIDVTATQFNIPVKVHVTSLEDDQYRVQCRNKSAIRKLKTWEDQSHLTNKSQLTKIIRDVVVELREAGFVE